MKLKVYTDWWSRGNPWNAWAWIYITDENWNSLEKRYKNLWIKTNNYAEYFASYLWIKRAIELWAKEIDYFTDSKLVIEQLSWKWKIKKDDLMKINTDIKKIIEENQVKVNFTWIKRELNKEADRLSNVAMDEKN